MNAKTTTGAHIWIEITNDAGEVESICTLASFRASNEETFDELEFASIEALEPGEHIAMGGGASPDVLIERCSEKRAAALDMIEAGCGGAIEFQTAGDEDPEETGALPYSIWFDGNIIGADTTIDRTIADALRTVAEWTKNAAVKS